MSHTRPFYEIQRPDPGLPEWHLNHVTVINHNFARTNKAIFTDRLLAHSICALLNSAELKAQPATFPDFLEELQK
jgi:hypothetical protein